MSPARTSRPAARQGRRDASGAASASSSARTASAASAPEPREARRPRRTLRPGSPAAWWHRVSGADGPVRGESPVVTYYVLLVSTFMLLFIGLMMVYSVQSVSSAASGTNSLVAYAKYLVFAVVGVVGMLTVSRARMSTLKKGAWWVMALALILQCLVFVPGVGIDIMGNSNWIRLPGGFTLQPSEFIKLGLCLVLGRTAWKHAADMRGGVRSWAETKPFLLRVGVPVGLGVGLVLGGGDMGTSIIIVMAAFGALWMAGLSRRWFVGVGSLGLLGFAVISTVKTSRRARITAWLNPDGSDPLGLAYQPNHARYALGTGGLLGVGPGGSRQKWGYLTQADSDYIFAIVGEELGLVGTVLVIALFITVAWCCVRIMRRSRDRFAVVTTAGLMTWIVGQALVNMCVVTGLLPVLGVPLPLISAGGSALIAVLGGIGVLLALARHEPGAQEALSARAGSVRRTLSVITPRRRNRA